MNIGQKHTLFVVGLMLMLLMAVSLSATLLIRQHVAESIEKDIARAHTVLLETQKREMASLEEAASSLAREPSLLAAVMSTDARTIRGVLENLHLQPEVDMVALYLDSGSSSVIAEGRKPHYTSPRMLAAPEIQEVVRRVQQGQLRAMGNVLLFDSFLRLAVIPLESPLGGRLGVMLVGGELNQEGVNRLKQLIRTELAVYQGSVVLGSTLSDFDPGKLQADHGEHELLVYRTADQSYSGQLFEILAGDGRTPVAQLFLGLSDQLYWAPYLALARQGILYSLLILLISALVGIGISRRALTRPIGRLAEATQRIAAGERNYQVNLNRNDELGQLAGSFNQMLDELGRSQSELEYSNRRFHDFAESSSDWLWETDAYGRFVFVSAGVRTSLGMDPEHFKGHSLSDLFPRDELSQIMGHLCPAKQRYQPFKDVECTMTLTNGSRHILRINGLPVLENGEFLGYRGTVSDISKHKQDEERMLILANQDQLTGLSNRRRFLVDLAHEIRRAQSRGSSGVLMLIDLDHLKMINDSAGHAIGDEMIVQVASALRVAARQEDMVARVSGDEFAVVMPDTSLPQAEARATDLLKKIIACRPKQIRESLNITASIGLVDFPEHGHEAVELMAQADTAMYAAKDAGRNRVRIYTDEEMVRQRMGSRLTWKTRVVEALEQDSFVLTFQPIASVLDGEIHHFETLVRMLDKDGSLILPGNFISTAEQFGLIGQVDRTIVAKAIRQLAALPAALSSIGISINLSGLSVGDADMLALIENTLEKTGVSPSRLTFEVTETAACENMARAQDFIGRIRHLGCRISLDDFGVGFSSFSYLKNLNVDILKIDGSFIRDVVHSREDQLFVKALVDVARGMGIRTVAEFVEDQAAFDFLRRVGVDYAQGWFVGKPNQQIKTRPVSVTGYENKPAVVNQ